MPEEHILCQNLRSPLFILQITEEFLPLCVEVVVTRLSGDPAQAHHEARLIFLKFFLKLKWQRFKGERLRIRTVAVIKSYMQSRFEDHIDAAHELPF